MSIYKENEGDGLQLRDYDSDFFKRLSVPGDGDCAYHSFLNGMRALYPDKEVPKTSAQLRKLLLSNISKEAMLPKSLQNGKNKNQLRALKQRIELGLLDKGSNDSWAENEELEMLSNMYNICIAVWSEQMRLWVYIHNNNVDESSIGLSGCDDIVFMYNVGTKACTSDNSTSACGCHYDAIVPVKTTYAVNDDMDVDDMDTNDTHDSIDNNEKEKIKELTLAKRFEYFKKQIELFDESKDYQNFIQPTLNLSKEIKPEITTHRLSQYPELLIDEVNMTPGNGFFYTKRQKFLKRFFSIDTNNVAILLFHDVGVGKTCSSILIAENFVDVFQKKVLVFLPSNLESNYRKELFDASKLNFKNGTYESCSGNRYLNQLPHWTKMNTTEINRKVQQMINDEYSFYGYLKIVNVVEKIKERARRKYPNDKAMRQQFLFWMVRDLFSNHVIIIDEIHNIRIANDKSMKKFPKTLKMILSFSENIRLVLLSATPMFDQPNELSWIMDFIYTADKHYKSYDTTIQFEDDNQLSDASRKRLAYFARNYVSYMKGYNPKTFPIKYFASKTPEYIPTKDMLTLEPFLDNVFNNDAIEYKFVASIMRPYQKKIYKKNMKSNSLSEDSEGSRDVQNTIQLSNLVYPESKGEEFDVKLVKGETGFKRHFTINQESSKGVKIKYSSSESKAMFTMSNLAKYSSKMYDIVNSINACQGLVIVYSKYLFSGVVPIALALEHLGYNKYNNQNLLDEKQTKNGNASYIILTADDRFSPNNNKELNVFNSVENKRGSLIKVALINDIAAEGVTFKNIREIHVLEPWYNMYKVEQIIGRGVRFMSHSELPNDERNVGIFLYVNMIDQEPVETIDYRRYRKALVKQERIQTVEKVLKESALDCGIDKAQTDHNEHMNVEFVDSKGLKRKTIVINPTIKCKTPYLPNPKNKASFDKSKERLFLFDVIELSKRLRNYIMSKGLHAFDKQSINKAMLDHELVDYALDYFVKKKMPIVLEGIRGYFISPYKDRFLFQPEDIDDIKITVEDRKTTRKTYVKRYTLVHDNQSEVQNSSTQQDDSAINSYESVILDKYNALLDMFKTQKQHKLDKDALMDMAVDHALKDPSSIPFIKTETIVNALVRGWYWWKDDMVYYNMYQKRFYCQVPDDNKESFLACGIKRNQQLTEKLINQVNKGLKQKEKTLGYMDIAKNDEIATKILHLGDPNKKSTGSACLSTSTFKVDMLKDYIKSLDNTIVLDKIAKKQLCVIYEYVLRSQNMFERPIERIIKKN